VYTAEEGAVGPPCACGEDAYFLAAPTPATAAIGIADGVGGWRNQGVDPGEFPRSLMNFCREAAEAEAPPDPKRLLELGYTRMQQGASGGPPGSSTVCLASLDRATGELSIANLGDSGAIILRNGEVVAASSPQQVEFNTPYQLSIELDGTPGIMSPDLAEPYTVKVQDGDLVLLMTDGVLDNLDAAAISSLVAGMPTEEPEEIARAIVQQAQLLSTSEFDSPFALAARAAGYWYPSQGKEDDITVVVARVEGVPGAGGLVARVLATGRDPRTHPPRHFQRKKKKGTRRNRQRK